MAFTASRRRSFAVVLMAGLLSAVGVLVGGSADASWCSAPNQLGNVSADAGATAVAVAQSPANPDAYELYACNDPGFQVWVRTTNAQPGNPGHQASVVVCPFLAGCTELENMGVEVGLPTTSVNPPADGNGSIGASVGTGSGVCPWVGAPNCQLGGGSYGFHQPLNEPTPNQDDIDVIMYAADTPNRCLYYIGWAGIDFGVFFCTWDAQGVPFFVVSELTT